MRCPARLLPAVLACTFALAACGNQPSDDASSGSDSTSAGTTSEQEPDAQEATTGIADDFPLSAGMGGPDDTIPTSRTGTGLRDLELCGTSPLRGLGTRDRMVADNSGGESLATRELVLLGSPDEAVDVAQAITDLATDCDRPTSGSMETTSEVRESSFGDAPAAVVVQGYVFDGKAGPGHLVVHVVPVGAALLVTQTYGEWPDVAEGIDETSATLTETVSAMEVFTEGAEPTATGSATASPDASPEIPDDFPMLAGWPESLEAEGGSDVGRDGPSRTAERGRVHRVRRALAGARYGDRGALRLDQRRGLPDPPAHDVRRRRRRRRRGRGAGRHPRGLHRPSRPATRVLGPT